MRPIGRFAPWFRVGRSDPTSEPLSYRAWKALWQHLTSIASPDLFDRIEATDWDLLIILDACRYDTLAEIADTAAVERAVSPTTDTAAFLKHARERGSFDGTTYVSANPQTAKHPPGEEINHVAVFETDWDERLQTVRAQDIYDVVTSPLNNGDRVVAHTIQPHYPHVCAIDGIVRPVPNGLHPAAFEFPTEEPTKMQRILATGAVDFDRARRSYRAATSHAWDLASRTGARLAEEGYTVAITADHGELFGEWGFVEHPVDVQVTPLLAVPWVEISPTSMDEAEETAKENLAALGYVD